MRDMTRSLAMLSGLALALALFAPGAAAQVNISPGSSQLQPPPPPPPTPNVPVPVTPMFGPRPQPNQRAAPQPSFSDRVVGCLQQGAAAGLGPNDRAAYSRSCANQQ
jgi:hypothetical protein